MLGDAAAFAQPFQHVAEQGFGGKPFRFEAPQFGERGIEELQPLVGTIDCYGCADAFEHLGVRADLAPQLGFRDFDVGTIKGKTDRASVTARQLDDVEQPPGTADDDMATSAGPVAACGRGAARDFPCAAATDRSQLQASARTNSRVASTALAYARLQSTRARS